MSTKTKTKSTKSRKATAVVKKSTKTKKPTTKKKTTTKKTSCCNEPRYEAEGWVYPDIADEFPYGDGNPVVVRYFYAVNHDTKEKYIISGDELPLPIARVIAEENTGIGEIAIVKVSSPIAWLLTRVFKVNTIDANDLISQGK